MKKYPLLIILIIVCALSAPTSVYSAGKGKSKKAATPVPIYHKTIGSISADSITVNFPPKKPVTYKIVPSTEIYYEGKKVAVDALKAGMRVNVNAGSIPDVATSIRAGAAPKTTSPPGK